MYELSPKSQAKNLMFVICAVARCTAYGNP